MAKKLSASSYKRKQHYRRKHITRRIRSAPIISLSKTYFVGVIQQASTADLTNKGGQQFQLNSCPDLVSHAALFDQYRICAVKLRFVPCFTESSGAAAANQSGIVWTYWDNTDATFPTNALEVMERKKFKLHNSCDRWTEYSRNIRVAENVYKTAATSGYAVGKPKTWISTADQNVPHYGWKWYAENMQNYNSINVYATLYVQFKDPK